MKKLLYLSPLALSLPGYCAIDISSQVGTFTTTAETYVTAALPAVFVVVGLYFLVRIIKRFTK